MCFCKLFCQVFVGEMFYIFLYKILLSTKLNYFTSLTTFYMGTNNKKMDNFLFKIYFTSKKAKQHYKSG